MSLIHSRRVFLSTLSVAGLASISQVRPAQASDAGLETSAVRILKNPGICIAPQYVAEELLRAEGFTDVRYIDQGPSLDLSAKVGHGDADFSLDFAARTVQTIDNGGAILVLGGV